MTALIVALLLAPAPSWARPGSEPVECPTDLAAELAFECPCEGLPGSPGEAPAWRNHGQYVRCVVHFMNDLRKSDCLTDDARRLVKRCSARSTCGKEGRVLCCLTEAGTCDDVTPGNLAEEGVCAGDPDVSCDTDADCTKTRARVAADEATCLADGGTAAGTGSVCTPCTPPTP
jgi:hypothetical protein